MSNANKPSGLVPVKYLNGAQWNGAVRLYSIASNNGSAFAIGDPVCSSGNADAFGIPGIAIGVAGSAIRGVLVAAGTIARGGPYVNPNNLGTIVVPATKTSVYYAAVVDDPNVIFEIQEVSGGTQLTAAEVGLNANFVAAANNGYVSGYMLDNSTEDTTSTLNLKLLGLAQYPVPDTNTFGAYAKWWVLINNHELRGGTTGV